MTEMRRHRSPRWLNARLRLARMTIPQWIALLLAAGCGGLVYWGIATLVAPHLPTLWSLIARIFVPGSIAGVLSVFFYALADDRREPFVRQAALYPFRRHRVRRSFDEEVSVDARSRVVKATHTRALPRHWR